MKTIIAQLLYEMAKGQDTVLVTIVSDAGSAPRGAGSQMLVGPQGRILGTIGGGAVEHLSEAQALTLLEQRRGLLQHFALQTSGEESIGMACGGDVDVLFQYIPADSACWQGLARAVMDRLEAKLGGWLVLRTDGGDPALLEGTGAPLWGEDEGSGPPRAGLTGPRFCLPLPRGERAVIFGAGHIAQALVPLLKTVDFRPVVYDDRPEYADPARFPDAEQVICGDFRCLRESLALTGEDYVVIMTNAHVHDFEVEEQVLRGELAYLGVIGSRSKIATVNAKLRELGIPQAQLDGIHTPIGTPIRAVTPAEIAISIAGEMIYVRALRREGLQPAQHPCPMG